MAQGLQIKIAKTTLKCFIKAVNMKKIALVKIVACLSACAVKDLNNSSKRVLDKLVSGSIKSDALKKARDIHLFRAIGWLECCYKVGRYVYYSWKCTRLFGVSSLLDGTSSAFYCRFNAETYNGKIQNVIWHGNECNPFLDRINAYFEKSLDLKALFIAEEMPKTKN